MRFSEKMLTFATSIIENIQKMKRILYTFILLLGLLNAAAQGIPATAVCQDTHYDCAVYINQERPSANEGEVPAVNSVWWKNLATGELIFVCQTNPNAAAHWAEMQGREAAAVEVPVTDIIAADQAKIAPGNGRQLIIDVTSGPMFSTSIPISSVSSPLPRASSISTTTRVSSSFPLMATMMMAVTIS